MSYKSMYCNVMEIAKIIFLAFLLLAIAIVPEAADGAVIFQDNFDAQPDTYSGGSIGPNNWAWRTQDALTATQDGVQHYAGEISAPGRGGVGKSLKMWRHSTFLGGYAGSLDKMNLAGGTSHFFLRYYTKIPAAFDSSDSGSGFKAWRINTSSGGEIYLNFYGGNGVSTRSSSALSLYDGGSQWYQLLSNTELKAIWDGNWHCLEFEIDTVNRILRLWVNGVSKYSNSDFPWRATGAITAIQHFAIGNTYDHNGHWQNSWQAMEIDDVVFSTTYNGPIGGSGANLEVIPPSGLKLILP